MKKFLKRRVLPMICAVSCLVSFFVVPASAAEFPAEFRDYDAVDDWNARLLVSNTMGMNALAQALKVPATANEIFWALVNGQVSNKAGEVNRSELEILASSYTAFFTSTIGETFGEQIKNSFGDVFNDMLARTLIGEWDPHFSVEQHPSSGLYRIKEMTTGLFVVDSAGRYPYAESSSEGFLGTDQWVPVSAMDSGTFRMMSKEALYNLADDVGGVPYTRGNYVCIAKNASSGVVDKMVLANEDGKPYVCWKDKNQSATEQDRPTDKVTENGDIIEGDLIDNSVNLDLEGMTMLLPGGTLAFIDQIIYDESTKSYHIDSHDTYNYTINNYYTWNYYINYTSITYIGQTEEYNKYYEVYYELPDGRSSADLTKEDLEQLNLSVDVIPYGRSADDTSLRSLYHFDGDTKDSSYWNYCTDFTWNQGASLTYMDAGVFDGALYLDETVHDFTLTLPSYIGSSPFTLQFRLYQSATPAPVSDSYISFGDEIALKFNGAEIQKSTGTSMSAMPVGTWNEIAIVRSKIAFEFYLNGVFIGTKSASAVSNLNNKITFHFGNEQQTFKYLDELRVLNYAIVSNRESYEPTAVPHDTNLTLVLPDSQVPVADEYWSFNTSISNLLPVWNFTEYHNTDDVLVYPAKTELYADFSNNKGADNLAKWYVWNSSYTNSQVSSAGYDAGSWVFRNDSDQFLSSIPSGSGGKEAYVPGHAFMTPLITGSKTPYGLSWNATYTFSVLLSNGEYKSLTFKLSDAATSKYQYVEFSNGGRIGYIANEFYTRTESPRYLFIAPPAHGSLDIVYMELVKGSTANTGHEFIESVTLMDKADLNTPSLAVRTDIDITSYQIGGVRPSLPEKGMVWAMVENDRIVSLQVYNGQAWEGVDGRIWTGERWIPMSSYNIITLQDLYDIVDATPNYEYIYSEAGFWAWWQKSWNAFTEKLFSLLSAGGASGGGVSITPETAPAVPDDEVTGEKGYNAIELFVVLKDGTWNFITGIVGMAFDGFNGFVESVSSAGNFFTVYDEDSENSIVFIPLEEGETIWD